MGAPDPSGQKCPIGQTKPSTEPSGQNVPAGQTEQSNGKPNRLDVPAGQGVGNCDPSGQK